MKKRDGITFAVLGLLLALAVVGLVVTSEWRSPATPSGAAKSAANSPPLVDQSPLQTAQALSALATTSEEQDFAREALRLGDHLVDLAFAMALQAAAVEPPPSDPATRALLSRVDHAQKGLATAQDDADRLTRLLASARATEKDAISQQLDLAKARLELSQDELDDAQGDLARSGSDKKSRIQRLVDEHNAAEHSGGAAGPLTLPSLQAESPANSLVGRVKALFALHSKLGRVQQAQRESTAGAEALTSEHNALEEESTQPKQSFSGSAAISVAPGASAQSAQSPLPDAATELSVLRHRSDNQKRLAGFDKRIQDEQDLTNVYASWGGSIAARERAALHSVLYSTVWILLIAFGVLLFNHSTERIFSRLAPDNRNLLTLRTVLRFASRAVGVVLALLVVFGPPSQLGAILALATAGLTVAMKDFIVGFFGWFVLMGKNGIRQGDWVEINGVSGEVVQIGLFHTVLLETGNWNDSGHPTGRRVTFVKSYAIEGHYFNFTTSGQWLWDELQVSIPARQDLFAVVDEIRKIVAKETEANARLAEKEWERPGHAQGMQAFSAEPAVSVRPGGSGVEVHVRYVTRASERFVQRSRLYYAIVELLRQGEASQSDVAPTAAAASSPAT